MPWTLGNEVHVDNLHANENVHIDGDPISLSTLTSSLAGADHRLGIGAMHYDPSTNVVSYSTTAAAQQQLRGVENNSVAAGTVLYDPTSGELTYAIAPPSGFYGTITINHTSGNLGTAGFRIFDEPNGTQLFEAYLSRGGSTSYAVPQANRRETFFFLLHDIPSNRSEGSFGVQNASVQSSQSGGRVIAPFATQWEGGVFTINFNLSD